MTPQRLLSFPLDKQKKEVQQDSETIRLTTDDYNFTMIENYGVKITKV